MKRNKLKITPYVLILALLCGVLVVVIDSLLDAFLFGERTFLEQLISPDPFEIYFRGVLFTVFFIFGFITSRAVYKLKLSEENKSKIILDLQKAKEELKVLQGILHACSYCKKIRDDKGDWKQFESYISEHTDTLFSHGMCPECEKKAYAELEIFKTGKDNV
jgi:hypothetical protein